MRVEVFKMSEDETFVKYGSQEVLIISAYGYDLFDTGLERVHGYRVETASGHGLKFFRTKRESLEYAKKYVRGKR